MKSFGPTVPFGGFCVCACTSIMAVGLPFDRWRAACDERAGRGALELARCIPDYDPMQETPE